MFTVTEYLLAFAGGLITYLIYDWFQVSKSAILIVATQHKVDLLVKYT